MKWTGLYLSVFLLTACDLGRKVDDMHDKTGEMADTTKNMDTKMETTNKKLDKTTQLTEQLQKLNRYLFQTARPAGGYHVRQEALKGMTSAESIGQKLAFAAVYFEGFEFQVWNGSDFDTQHYRGRLVDIAAEEFFKEVQEYEKSLDLIPLSNRKASFYALATALHQVGLFQEEVAGLVKVREISMLDIIEEGLRKRDMVNAGELGGKQISISDTTVLHYKDLAVRLLRARQNFTLVIPFCEMMGLGNGWDGIAYSKILENFGQLKPGFWGFYASHQIEGRLETKDITQVRWWNKYMRASLRMRKLLVDLREDSRLESGWNKMDVWQTYSKIRPVTNIQTLNGLSGAQQLEIARYSNLVKLVLASDSDFQKVVQELYSCTELECEN